MDIGMIGLGRMGANMARRLMNAKHRVVAHDVSPAAVDALAKEGAVPAKTLAELLQALPKPRVLWLMIPAAFVDASLEKIAPLLDSGDILIDGGNSHYHDDLRRAKTLAQRNLHYVDVGTSGGVYGLERGYCLMIGGESAAVAHLEPLFKSLAPDAGPSLTPAQQGYLHCGPNGAGHFVKMIHNGIEYGLMAAYAEGLNILKHANVGKFKQTHDAETTPLRHPELYQYDFDLAQIAEVWRHGSVISSWLLDLTAQALAHNPRLQDFSGQVSDSGEGRWTLSAAIDEAVPAPVLATALFSRFSSRGQDDFANRILSAMRYAFGGHIEKPPGEI